MNLNGPLEIVFNVFFFAVFLGFLTGVLFVLDLLPLGTTMENLAVAAAIGLVYVLLVLFKTPSRSGPDTLG